MQVAKYVYVKKFDIRILILILDGKNNRNKQTNWETLSILSEEVVLLIKIGMGK